MLNILLARLAQQGAFFCATCGFAVACLILGGGTRSGFLSDTIIQLLAIPILLASLWRYFDLAREDRPRWAIALPLAIAVLPALQLVPLPPQIWSTLPGRQLEVQAFTLLGSELPWAPISISPTATWLSLISLLPPLAIFHATTILGYQQRRELGLVLLAVAVISVFLGLSQVAQGPTSPLRFVATTNVWEAVGFFANRNHYAALLYCMTLFAAVWAVDAVLSASASPKQRQFDAKTILPTLAGFTLLVAFLAGQIIARSRAGLVLSIIALIGAFALALSDRRSTVGMSPTKLLLGVITATTILLVQFALYRVMDRFTADPLADARVPFARNTIEAASAYMPLGSGVGTFVPAYAIFEKPEDSLANVFANRAHNDFLELWLETGLPGITLLTLCLVWLLTKSVQIWRRPPLGARSLDVALARAASLAVGLLIIHSIVDYPFRTAAMMTVLAFCCALLIEPPAGPVHADAEQPSTRQRELVPRGATSSAAVGTVWAAQENPVLDPRIPPSSRPSGEQWGSGIKWPDNWRKP